MNANPLDRVMIIGASGLLGPMLLDDLNDHFSVNGTTRDLNNSKLIQFDLRTLEFHNFFDQNFSAVVMCAGITNIKQCENNPEVTEFVNVIQTLKTIEHFVNKGSHVIWFSSNSVFGGRIEQANEDDLQEPLLQYALQKCKVENAISSSSSLSSSVAIIRLTKALTSNSNLIKNLLLNLRAGHKVNLLNDLYLSPISVGYVSSALKLIIRRRMCGIFHLSGEKSISYSDLGKEIARGISASRTLIAEESIKDSRSSILYSPKNATLGMTLTTKMLNISPERIDNFLISLIH